MLLTVAPAVAQVKNLGGVCQPLHSTDIQSVDTMRIGRTWELTFGFVEPWCAKARWFFGTSDPKLPIFGPCTMHTNALCSVLTAAGGKLCLPVPNDVTLLGSKVYVQAMWTAKDWTGTPWKPALSDGYELIILP